MDALMQMQRFDTTAMGPEDLKREPGTHALLGLGLTGLAMSRKREVV